MVLLQRFTVELNQIAESALPRLGSVANLDIQLLTAVARARVLSPSEAAAAVNRPRSSTSRAIARMAASGLLERGQSGEDGRRADLRLTDCGLAQVDAFVRALADLLVASRPVIIDVLSLLRFDSALASTQPPSSPLDVAHALTAAGAAFVSEVTPVVHPYGISTSVERFAVVEVAAEGQMRPAQLCSPLGLSPPGVSSLLERLESRGLVIRHSGVVVTDGRGVMVAVTPSGSKAARAVVAVFRRHAAALAEAVSKAMVLDRPAG